MNKINLNNIGELIISEELETIFDALHSKLTTEWSGILFYKIIKGDIANLKDLKIEAKYFYLIDIGGSAATNYRAATDESVQAALIKAYDIYPEGLDMSFGFCHSHHSMDTFFSSTDMSELEDNFKNYNYYLSLIVNYNKKYSSKIAIYCKTKSTDLLSFRNTLGKFVSHTREFETENMLLGDLKVSFERNISVPSWVNERIREIEAAKKVISVPDFFPTSLIESKYSPKGFEEYETDSGESIITYILTLGKTCVNIKTSVINYITLLNKKEYKVFLINIENFILTDYVKENPKTFRITLTALLKWIDINKEKYGLKMEEVFTDLKAIIINILKKNK